MNKSIEKEQQRQKQDIINLNGTIAGLKNVIRKFKKIIENFGKGLSFK